MNEETKELLLKYLQAGAERIERGSAFVEAEIPLVVTEYLNWYWWSGLFLVLLGLLFMFIGVPLFYGAKWSFKKYKEDYKDGFEVLGVILAIGAIGMPIAGLIVSAENSYSLVKVSVAPRVVLLEKIAEIAK